MDDISKVKPKVGQFKKQVSWGEYIDLVKQLAKQLEHTRYTSIAGIPRGGLIPAVILSHKLGLPLIPLTEANFNTLVVDDICDSGKTLLDLTDKEKKDIEGRLIGDVAVLHLRHSSKYKPKFFVEELKDDTWQIYPYEQVAVEDGNLSDYC